MLRWSSRTIKRVKLYSRAGWDSPNAELKTSQDSLCLSTEVNSALSQWNTMFLSVLCHHIPHRLVTHTSIPWLTTQIIRLLRRRDSSHSRAKAYITNSTWSKFRSLRNRSVAAVQAAKWAFQNSLDHLNKSRKEFWSLYHSH